MPDPRHALHRPWTGRHTGLVSDAPHVPVDVKSFWADPYPTLALMRAEAPICFVPELGATLITRRDDIHTCEKNVAVFSSEQPGGLMNVLMGRNMMRKDGEEHRKERFVYYSAISPKKVQAFWNEQFGTLTERVLDELPTEGSGDLVPSYATAVSGESLKIITGLTNITFSEMDQWSQAMIDGIANYAGDTDVEARCHLATAAIDDAISARLPELQAQPDANLLSVMVAGGMPLDQVRANIKLTISGGQNEPRDAIAGAVWALLNNPEQRGMVDSGQVRWMQVFDEYCRWIAPIGMSPRRVAKDFEYHSIDGLRVRFEAEERVFFMFSSANRDEHHFEHPDRFDLRRDTGPALTFGAGPHFCAGAAASRSLVGDNALPRLFDRRPRLRLDHSSPPVQFGGWAFRGPLNVPVEWGP